MKIAPALRLIGLKMPWCTQCGSDADAPACGPTHATNLAIHRQASAELRALLAVARAAKAIEGTVNGDSPMGRALARLERVSRKP